MSDAGNGTLLPHALGRKRRSSLALPGAGPIGAVILLVVAGSCIVVPILSPYATDAFVAQPFEPPSASHLFGTDGFGRDLFTRVFAGGRVNLLVAAVGVTVPLTVGTVAGVAFAMTRFRRLDALFVRVTDAVIAFPFIVLVLALVLLFGTEQSFGPLPAGMPSLFTAIFLVGWTIYARLARAETLALRERDYIVAARLLGYGPVRIASRHLLPSVLRTTATYAVSDVVLVVAVTASLSFLGAGIQPPNPEWGSIMYEGRAVLADSWWVTVMPGLVLILFGIGVTLVADALIGRRGGE